MKVIELKDEPQQNVDGCILGYLICWECRRVFMPANPNETYDWTRDYDCPKCERDTTEVLTFPRQTNSG